jgi:hypothetical protein
MYVIGNAQENSCLCRTRHICFWWAVKTGGCTNAARHTTLTSWQPMRATPAQCMQCIGICATQTASCLPQLTGLSSCGTTTARGSVSLLFDRLGPALIRNLPLAMGRLEKGSSGDCRLLLLWIWAALLGMLPGRHTLPQFWLLLARMAVCRWVLRTVASALERFVGEAQ